ncbi:MFS transporter [Pseudomonas aeruginosa]|nr:MFS transporter [Pseudomonas aeruginosa]
MNGHARHWIDGAWLDSAQRGQSFDPASGQPIGTYADGGRAEADAAIAAAVRAFEDGPWKDDHALRAKALEEIAAAFERHADALIDLLALENGKIKPEAAFEVGMVPGKLRYYAGLARSERGASGTPRPDVVSLVLREPMGVAEAGFFPGIILYLTYWFPQRSRAQALGLFYFGLPLALVLGGPLSGWLLEFHGIFGLANWQWLFVTEGLLASLVGIAAYFYLVDRPRDAGWLSDEQKRALEGELAEEDTRKQARGPHGFLSALRSGQVLKFCLVYFTIQMSVYGVVFYLPTRIASFLDGQVGLNVGLITAIPWVCALVVTRLVTRQADRSGQHRQLAVAMLGMAAAGIAASALAGNLGLAVIAFCFAASGFVSVQPLFWTLPTGYLSGAAAASGIALINSLGNLGGFVAPNLKTLMESQFADPRAGMFALAAVGLLGACLLARLKTSGSSSVPLRARQAG